MKLLIAIAIGVGLIYVIDYLSSVLLPFFVAAFIAYLVEPLVQLNRKWIKTKGRVLAVVVTLLEITLVLAGVVYIFVPSIITEMHMLSGIINDYSSGAKELPPIYHKLFNVISRYFDPKSADSLLNPEHLSQLIDQGTSILSQSIDVLVRTFSVLMTLIYIIFILIDYPAIVRGFKMIVPFKYRSRSSQVLHDAGQSVNHYFRGQGVVALCAVVLYCVGFSIVGLPLAIPMGVLVGVLYMIPYFQYVTLIPVAAISFIYSLSGDVSFFSEFGQCILVYVVSQCVCDYIITPHVMGKEMGLNPAMILLSLSIWGYLLGIIGMIIALPVTSLIMAYYERYISNPAPAEQSCGSDDPSGVAGR